MIIPRRYALPCTPKTAHSTPSNCPIQVEFASFKKHAGQKQYKTTKPRYNSLLRLCFIPIVEAFFTSTVLVALAEIGDKTQLLSLVLAAKLRQPRPIIGGIFAATLLNHALAAWAGAWLAGLISAQLLNWIVGLSFIGCGLWALKPDTLEGDPRIFGAGVFVTTLIAFFLAEMGDKTQFATVALAARYDALVAVVSGTTLGMMLVNAPVVWAGKELGGRISTQKVRWLAAASFLLMGVWSLTISQYFLAIPE